jgi:hypothetical protein
VRTLFLHVGHGKTGSTWIQSSLRLSRSALTAHGIDYVQGVDGGAENPLRVTSGNGQGLLDSSEALDTGLARAAPSLSALYSNEDLHERLHDGAATAFLTSVAGRRGFDRIELLLFIRNPLGHAASRWVQWVKDRGLTEPLEAHFAAFDMPDRVARLLDRLATVEGVGVTVLNYSHCGDRLLVETAAWLSVPTEALTPPPAEHVNRSLTRAELALQLQLNARLGACHALVAYPLIERLPDVRPEAQRPSLAVQQATWTRLLPGVASVNARLPAEHQYRCDIQETPPPPEDFTISPAQIGVIADGVADEITRLRGETERLRASLAHPETALGARQLLRALLRRLGRVLARRLSA